MIKPLLNPDQAKGGTLQIAKQDVGCCGSGKSTGCQWSWINFSASVTSITFFSYQNGGGAVTMPIGAYSSNAELEALIKQAFIDAGFSVEGTDTVTVVDNASNKDIYIYTTTTIAQINSTVPTKKCVYTSICDYTLVSKGGTNIPFVQNGGTPSLLTFGSGTDASAVKTAIEGAATGEISVTVTKDAENNFTIVITHLNNMDFSLDGKAFEKSNCRPQWTT